jgi:cytoskeletal protein CcmA (bactofilin family)
MSFFRREPDRPQPPEPSRSGSPQVPRQTAAQSRVTLVAEGTRVTGEISGDTEVRVDGEVEGDLDLGARVVIGGSGVVRGSIQAQSVEVGGRVHGNVQGSDRVEVTSSGSLEGDISAPRVTIAEGAFFKGKVEMTGSPGGGRGERGRPSRSSGPSADATQTTESASAPEGDESGAKR